MAEKSGNPGVLYFYLQWADEMNARWRAHGTADSVSTMYMRTWIGALYANVEGWNELKLTDLVVDRLLALKTGRKVPPSAKETERDETFVDVLRRARNDVFHFSGKHHPPKIAAFFDTPGALPWANNLHAAFRAYFDERARRLEAQQRK